MLDLLNPIAIVEQAPLRQYDYAVRRSERAEKRFAEGSLGWMYSHVFSNQRDANGRVNSGYDEQGNVRAITVSPHSDHFWYNIEPKVEPLIRLLVHRGYLPFSSCDGHREWGSRYVYLAFDTVAKAGIIGDLLKKLFWYIPGVVVEYSAMPHNVITDTLLKEVTNKEQMEKMVLSFNTVFHKHYDNYHCLRFRIFREYKDIFLKDHFWDRVTNHIVRRLNKYLPNYADIRRIT